jgi:hypothetical protein
VVAKRAAARNSKGSRSGLAYAKRLTQNLFAVGDVLACVRAVVRSMLVLVVLVAAAGGSSAHASGASYRSARLVPASHVVLGSSFQQVTGANGVEASGDYLLLSTTVGDASQLFEQTGWTVINQRTGATTALDPQCELVSLGPPWVLMRCPSTSTPAGTSYEIVLYSLTNGTKQTVPPIPGVPYCPFGPGAAEDECATPYDVGADWIKWEATCYHCAITSYFQNIQTGEVRDDPTDATTYADLNSPTLAHKTCAGVRLLRGDFQTPWGSLSPDGQFALVTGSEVNAFLERCGTRMQRQLVNESSASSGVTWNAGAVVWQAVTTQLDGLFLPGLQTFTIPLPSAIVKPPGAAENTGAWFVLTSGTLYVKSDYDGTIWRTVSPTALPVNTRRPTVTRSGDTLTCKRGSWRQADRFSHAYLINGIAHRAARPALTIAKARRRRRISCSVTASNPDGATTASSASLREPSAANR